MKTRWLISLTLTFTFLAGVAPASETIESIEEQILTNWAKVKSLSANMRLETERKYLDRVKKKLTTGTYLFQRDEKGLEMVRQELDTQQETEMTLGKDTPMVTIPNSERQTMVSDGRIVRSLAQGTRGSKAAMMFHKGSGIVLGGRQLLDSMRKEAQLTVLPDSRFEGREAWAIQASQNRGYTKITYLIDKEWGFLLQRIAFYAEDEDDLPATTYTISNIKVNTEDVARDRFDFEFPPGMEVVDETKDD